MLQLILGVAGTGKTRWMIRQLARRAETGKTAIFLVPEQFSSSAENLVYTSLGDAGSRFVEVVSFRTLAERILKSCGGITTPVMTDASRAVFVRRAIEPLGEELPTFARHRRDTMFCNLCAETISELKTAGATPETLAQISRAEDDPKWKELALIFAAYETKIKNAAMDPEDRLERAAKQSQNGYFAGKSCFIDNFDGFTHPEYQLLEQILGQCEDVCVALCCDTLGGAKEALNRFSPVQHTAHKLINLDVKSGHPMQKRLILTKSYRASTPGTKAAAQVLMDEDPNTGPAPGGLFLTKAADEWEEARLVATEMYRLALTGVPYNQMAVVCRDMGHYRSAIRRAFSLFSIPCFIDAPDTIEFTAPITFLRAALALLRQGLVSQPILALLKTGLCGYGQDEVSLLENYVYTWQPKASDWRRPFENNPAGLLQKIDEKTGELLSSIETMRAGFIPLLDDFIQSSRNLSVYDLSKQLYALMEVFQAPEHLEATALAMETQGDFAFAEKTRRAWDLSMDLLDQMALLLGEDKLTPTEYEEYLLLLVRSTDFGQAPQSLECAIFTSADRMRLADPEYCFVVGLSEGEFPRQVGYSGLLNHADREKLVEHHIELPGSFENRVLLEDMFFYRALTAPRRGLYLSWPSKRAGTVCAMSSALKPIQQTLQPKPLSPTFIQKAATPQAAFELLGHLYRDNSAQAASLYTALAKQEDSFSSSALPMLQDVHNPAKFSVAKQDGLQTLLGKELTISATRAEQFYRCHFAYYLDRILGIQPRRRAAFSPLESGSFVHHVLEKVLCECKSTFKSTPDAQLISLAKKYAAQFIEEYFPRLTHRTAYLLDQIQLSIGNLLIFMRDCAAKSEFSIDALELPIADRAGAVPPLELTTLDGRHLQVTGKIDRVDVLHKDGKSYLCIIDYKTGDRKFDLEDVKRGLNIQMMVYMHTLCNNSNYENPVPMGVLYLTTDPTPQSGDRQGKQGTSYHIDGLLLNDPAALEALDGSGMFLPIRYKKDGTPYASKKLADLEAIGEIHQNVEQLLTGMADSIYRGDFPAIPQVRGAQRPCNYCAYRAVCRHEDGRNEEGPREDEVSANG